MMSNLKVGIIVADVDEYAPLEQKIQEGEFKTVNFLNRTAHSFSVCGLKNEAEIISINCGIGKVNATAAAMFLVDSGCDVVLNFGFSGGVSGISRGELTLPNAFLEHDFDLTGIGYAPCEKPGQKSIYPANEVLIELFLKTVCFAKSGTAVTGDSFICDETRRTYLAKTFGAMSCDMETSAIAYVCDSANIPFLALRKVSDDAGSDAYDNYSEMNSSCEAVLSDLILDFVKILADSKTEE